MIAAARHLSSLAEVSATDACGSFCWNRATEAGNLPSPCRPAAHCHTWQSWDAIRSPSPPHVRTPGPGVSYPRNLTGSDSGMQRGPPLSLVRTESAKPARESFSGSLHALAAALPQAAFGAGPRVAEPRLCFDHSQSALGAARRLLDVDVAAERLCSRGKVTAGSECRLPAYAVEHQFFASDRIALGRRVYWLPFRRG
jgi:hypothetical protein